MKATTGLLMCGVMLAALVLAVAPLMRGASRSDSGYLAEWVPLGQLLEAQRRTDELDEQLAIAVRHLALRKEVSKELIAQRLTLREAATRFQALARENASYNWVEFRRDHPGRTEEERFCRHVIGWVEMTLKRQPGETAKVVARLEAEL
jgi:hypothetical protein